MVSDPKIPDSPKCVLENKRLVLGVTLGESPAASKFCLLSALHTQSIKDKVSVTFEAGN